MRTLSVWYKKRRLPAEAFGEGGLFQPTLLRSFKLWLASQLLKEYQYFAFVRRLRTIAFAKEGFLPCSQACLSYGWQANPSLSVLSRILSDLAVLGGPNKPVKYVYLIQSIDFPNQRYVGLTSDLKARLQKHNEGGSPHTSKYKPWKLVTFIRFEDDDKAVAFEKYLKSGSGRAFANKHLW